jgi:trimethylamine:corrinoid methyltransferase-like protein
VTERLFHDNELQHAIYLEAEFRSLRKGDLSITDYCTRLTTLGDNLHDLGQPVFDPSQVPNLLRELNPMYRHLKPVITTKSPPPQHLCKRKIVTACGGTPQVARGQDGDWPRLDT